MQAERNVVCGAAKDAVATAAAAPADLALAYEQHNAVAEQTKAEYLELNRQMVVKLSAEHLEPFAKILLERDNCALMHQHQIAESLRQNLLQTLDQKLHNFWTDFEVANGITSLEMLKEKFRDFEGTDWNLQSKTPQQRTLPTRMRFKEMRLRLLRKQLQSQRAQLDEIKNINGEHRARIRQVEQQRLILGQQMERCIERFDKAKPELLRMLNEAAGDAD